MNEKLILRFKIFKNKAFKNYLLSHTHGHTHEIVS